MTLIGFPARLHSARSASGLPARDRQRPAAAALAFLRHVARRIANSPLDSPVLLARPVPRTQVWIAAREAEHPVAAQARTCIADATELRQHWLPLACPDGKVRLVAHWSPRT